MEFGEVQLRQFADMHSVNLKCQALGLEAVAVTFGAGDGVHEALCPLL